jgi:S1-C subfamily serine protease
MGALDELQRAVAAVADGTRSGIVRIDGGWRGASGVVVSDGSVLTNAHNVHGDQVGVVFAGGRTADGTLAGVDADSDLAVISVDTAGATPIAWGPDGSAAVGLPVFASSATQDDVRVTWGLVSSVSRDFRGPRGRRIRGSIEHTAPMAPGSSGSALLDAEGRLIGLNTNRVDGGFYLALPTDSALRTRVEALASGKSVARPRLGVGIAPSWAARRMRNAVGLPERDGLLVRDVEEGSPAERAGITVGDLIVEAAGKAVGGSDDLFDALASVEQGQLTLTIVRGADERTVQVTFDQGA